MEQFIFKDFKNNTYYDYEKYVKENLEEETLKEFVYNKIKIEFKIKQAKLNTYLETEFGTFAIRKNKNLLDSTTLTKSLNDFFNLLQGTY